VNGQTTELSALVWKRAERLFDAFSCEKMPSCAPAKLIVTSLELRDFALRSHDSGQAAI
jgi:hypothetical protein